MYRTKPRYFEFPVKFCKLPLNPVDPSGCTRGSRVRVQVGVFM